MRRTQVIVLAAVVLLGGASGVAAQSEQTYLRTPHRAQIFVDGGIAVPANPATFKDFWNPTLPFNIGAGAAIFPWLDVNGVFSYAKFNNNNNRTKQNVGYTGIGEVSGGSLTSITIAATVRFLAVPNNRANPFLEVGLGSFNNKFEDLIIADPNSITQETILEKSAENVSGIATSVGGGLQYALNERWSSYVKYYYAVNLNKDFRPGPIVGEPASVEGGNQQFSVLSIGMLVRF